MDDLTESIGKLNTNAKEWRPATNTAAKKREFKEWVPPSVAAATTTTTTTSSMITPSVMTTEIHYPSTTAAAGGAAHPIHNNLVKVYRNGTQIEVPVEEAHLYDEDEAYAAVVTNDQSSSPAAASDVEDGDQQWWMLATSTVPAAAPPKRSLMGRSSMHQMWAMFQNMSREALREMEPQNPLHKAVPAIFGNAYCLDPEVLNHSNNKIATLGGYPCHTFKVVSKENGLLYCLRRLDNVKCVSHKICSAVHNQWFKFSHPGVCKLEKCFFSQRTLFFLHEYYPGSITLKGFLSGKQMLPEPLIWSYAIQLVAVLRKIHSANMACRCLSLNKILLTHNQTKLRINCVGVLDALEIEARKSLQTLQNEDLRHLAMIILSLTTSSVLNNVNNAEVDIRNRLMFTAQNYSQELHSLILTILTRNVTILDVVGLVANQTMNQLDIAHSLSDSYFNSLSEEYESSRALRLLLKLGFVNERPFGIGKMNNQWSETGDCYVLKLFRDFVFHQADEHGNPILDMGHVVTALNKLDAADTEKIVLTSRDASSILVVSYADVARCLNNAYAELCSAATHVKEFIHHNSFDRLNNR